MGESNRGTTILIFVMIGALLVALIGIGSIFLNLLNGGSINSILGGSTPVSAETVVITPEADDPMQDPPKSTRTQDVIDYNFTLLPNTYNADSVRKEAKSFDDPSPVVAADNSDPGTVKGTQATPTPSVAAGVKDTIVTAEVKQLTKQTVKAKPTNAPATNINRIIIPAINVNSPVVQGSDGDKALDQGMWLYPTSYARGEKVLLCHRRYFGPNDPRSCWFMDRVKTGDIISLQSRDGKSYRYEIVNQGVRRGDDLAIFRAGDDDIVKIITCTPLGSSTHRLITIAKRVG